MKGKGVLPVAILGTDFFDVTMVDPTTVTLAGVPADQWAFEDVSSSGDCSALEGDGYLDLVLHFDIQSVVAALGEVSDGDLADLMLEGYILPDLGYVHFSGFNTVTILMKGK